VEVRIVADEIDHAILVPTGALFRRGDAWNVFVVDQGRAHLREIKVTRLSARVAAIAKGIWPGDIVVVYPPSALAEGSKIRVQ